MSSSSVDTGDATDRSRVVSAGDAAGAVIAGVAVQPAVRMPLLQSIGHRLAADFVAPFPLPPWTNASMDGYAVRAVDVAGATPARPARLQVVAEIAAGAGASRALAAGEAMRIYTGAPVPVGADSVVRQEDTDRGATIVAIHSDRDSRANIRLAGGDLALGATALPAGTRIGPYQLALLAALGETQPMVYRRPRVGIMSTGDEVVSIDQVELIRRGERLADVNSVALAALVEAAGGVAVPLGIAADSIAAVVALVSDAADVDLLITAGGVSVGDHDHVRAAMHQLGATRLFDRIAMRPGGPTTFGTLPDGRCWLGLPGNPVSAMVTFDLFGRTAIRTMAGDPQPQRHCFDVRLRTAIRREPLLDQYVRCTFATDPDSALPRANATGHQGSGMLMSIVRADGLILIPHGEGEASAGEIVSATRFD